MNGSNVPEYRIVHRGVIDFQNFTHARLYAKYLQLPAFDQCRVLFTVVVLPLGIQIQVRDLKNLSSILIYLSW